MWICNRRSNAKLTKEVQQKAVRYGGTSTSLTSFVKGQTIRGHIMTRGKNETSRRWNVNLNDKTP